MSVIPESTARVPLSSLEFEKAIENLEREKLCLLGLLDT